MHARYEERAPPPTLQRQIACLWEAYIPAGARPHVERVIPDGCIDLLWVGGRLLIAGPDTAAHEVPVTPAGAHLVGVRFLPGVGPVALGLPAHPLRDRRPDAEDVLGDRARRLVDDLHAAGPGALLAHSAEWLARADPVDRLVARTLQRLRGPRARAGLAAELGVSDRQLRRRFIDAVGYGPKMFERIARLRRFIAIGARAGPGHLGELAAAAGYADQPHLSRDVRELAGCTPAELAGYPVTAG